jgi:hypothetical protein
MTSEINFLISFLTEIEDLYSIPFRKKRFSELYSIPWKTFLRTNKTGKSPINTSSLNILIINNPCMGFGDIVYAMKLTQYLREWYKCNVKIATTQPNAFKQLGENEKNLLWLKNDNVRQTKTSSQCRRNRLLSIYDMSGARLYENNTIYDLIFVAPLTADFKIDYKDIKSIIPYSNKFNTFFFSEYNDSLRKHIDFNTGVGDGRLGLFLTDISNDSISDSAGNIKKKVNISDEYAMIYIAQTIPSADRCLLSFVELVCKKYSILYNKFTIVIPAWVKDDISITRIMDRVNKYFDKIIFVYKNDVKKEVIGEGKKVLTFRLDVYPLQNKDMINLIKHSVRDILLTGDQSITDALSCCIDKNIFYQIAPWKENFGKFLASKLPNKYLKSKTTSCGTLNAINYNSNYTKFKNEWDFRKLAKPKLDAIVLSVINENDILKTYKEIVSNSKKFSSFEDKMEKYLEEYMKKYE